MRIKEQIQKDGYFWLPSTPDKKIPGTLVISDGGQIELEIVGLFNDEVCRFNDNETIERIIGKIETHGLVTLDDCFYLNKNYVFDNIAKSSLCVNRAFFGFAYKHKEEVTFNSFQFSIEGIDEWVGVSGINVDIQYSDRSASIFYKLPEDIVFNLNNGMYLTVTFRANPLRLSHFQKEVTISQKTYFKLTSAHERKLDDFESIAHKITTLLCFAIDETVSLEKVTATSCVAFKELNDGRVVSVPISVYYASVSYSDNEPVIKPHRMLFGFNQIRDNAEQIINCWIEAYNQVDSSLNLYFSVKTDSYKYLEGKFLALAQTLETYHRRTSTDTFMEESEFREFIEILVNGCPKEHKKWLSGKLQYGNEVSLRNRIKNLIEPFSNLFGDAAKTKKLTCWIVDTRNYLTHYDKSLEAKAASGRDLWVLCIKMEIIFQLHMLRMLGFTAEQINSILENNYKIQQKLKEN